MLERRAPCARAARLRASPKLAPAVRVRAPTRRVLAAGASNSGNSGAGSKGRAIVVAVDDDQLSWEAVRFTVQELYRDGDVLHLLHVIPRDSVTLPVPPAAMGSMSYCESMDYEELLWDHATQFIRQHMVGLAAARNATCEVDIVRGACRESIGQAICKAADQLGAWMVVVPGRQKPGLVEHLFCGDSAAFGSYVAKHASQPTLIYQPSERVQQAQQQQQQQQELGVAAHVPSPSTQ